MIESEILINAILTCLTWVSVYYMYWIYHLYNTDNILSSSMILTVAFGPNTILAGEGSDRVSWRLSVSSNIMSFVILTLTQDFVPFSIIESGNVNIVVTRVTSLPIQKNLTSSSLLSLPL